jgi:protein-S-isoprenylcysteine O-methyltransferase Ste14
MDIPLLLTGEFMTTFQVIFLICWAIYFFVLYAPHLRKIKKEKVSDDRKGGLEIPLSFLALIGMQIVPLVYVFSNGLDFADYSLPAWTGWLGAVIFTFALWITWRAHQDLGRNWTPTVQIKQDQALVTNGIYAYLRHPIYAAQWLWVIAQFLLLHNWIAGPAALVGFAPIFFYRLPKEEKMMIEYFGEEYRAYMQKVGGFFPKL